MKTVSNKKLFLKYQKYLLPYLRKAILSLGVSTVALVLGMLTPLITKVLIDYAYPNRDIYLLTFLVVGGVVIFLLQQFFDSISNYIDMYTENDLLVKLKGKFYDRLQRFSLKFHGERQVGDLMFRLTEDIESVVSMIVQFIAVLLQTVFQLGFLLVICLIFDWKLTLLALSGIPLYFLETKFFAKKRQEVTEQELAKNSEITSFLQEKIPAIKMIKAFNREDVESKIFQNKMKQFFHIARQGHIVEFFNTFTDSFIKTVWLAALGWYAGLHVIKGVLSIGEVVAIMVYVTQIYGPVLNLGNIYKFVVEGMVSVKRIDDVLARKEDVEEDLDGIELKEIKGDVEFQGISFSYLPEEPILDNINLTVPCGKSVALVGPSGVGKTTLTDLIMRFYSPDKGRVFIDGQDIAQVKIGCLRKFISTVSQEITIFKGTIKENIRYGNLEADDEDVIRAAKQANAHEFIEKLPLGYKTILEERGLNLSGGQRQRITIARALIRNPQILILDEATSSVDPESESYIHDALMHFKKDKTIISIAHRLSTIMSADEVVYLNDGQIIEKGSFKDLMDQKGEFFEFYEMEYGNFHFFVERLHREVLRSRRYKRPLSLVMFEIEEVGKLTQEAGEEGLSEVVLEVIHLIRKEVRNVDFVAKYQKERFLLCVPETGFNGARLVAERMRETLNKYVYLKNAFDVHLRFAMGVASLKNSQDMGSLFRDCEKMLEGKLARS